MNDDNNKKSLFDALKNFLKGPGHSSARLNEQALRTPLQTVMLRFVHNKLAVFASVGFLLVLCFCFIGSVLIPIDKNYTELTNRNLSPSIAYLNFPNALSNVDVKKISSGVSFSAAVTEQGDFYIWGTEPNKQQNNISTLIFDVPPEVYDNKIIDVACGANHVVVLDENGVFYSWGFNSNQQTEIPREVTDNYSGLRKEAVQMQAMAHWTAVLGSDGYLDIWGSTQAKNTLLVSSRINGKITAFAGGDSNIALLLNDGTVEIVGDRGTEFAQQLPIELTDGSVFVTQIAATNRNVIALDENGKLYSWGSSQDNLTDIPAIDKATSIAAGYKNLVVLSKDDELIIWGDDTFSQLEKAAALPDAEHVFADYFQFYAIEDDGTVHAFGNKGYVFGTDHYGRDILTRIIHGGRISLTVGAVAVVISVFIAMFVGLTAGYFGGWVDHLLMRVTDVFSAIPFYPIAITLSFAIGFELSETQKLFLIMAILGLLGWTSLARLIRAQLLLEREKDFVLAAQALGIKSRAIMWRHILPNIFNLIIVNITLSYAASLLTEASLSFLGFGVAEPTPSWGNMLTAAQELTVIEFYWWRWLIPALFVIFAALCVNVIGDALREAMDPREND